jgi:hypothetical protein
MRDDDADFSPVLPGDVWALLGDCERRPVRVDGDPLGVFGCSFVDLRLDMMVKGEAGIQIGGNKRDKAHVIVPDHSLRTERVCSTTKK